MRKPELGSDGLVLMLKQDLADLGDLSRLLSLKNHTLKCKNSYLEGFNEIVLAESFELQQEIKKLKEEVRNANT